MPLRVAIVIPFVCAGTVLDFVEGCERVVSSPGCVGVVAIPVQRVTRFT